MSHLTIFNNITTLRAQIKNWRRQGLRIALVPTMGALHGGHLALISAAIASSDRVIVSIFVNPTQFGKNEDLTTYPCHLSTDIALIKNIGANAIFTPTVQEMYPQGFATIVSVPKLNAILCGRLRPHHFDGVSQIVIKLLNQTSADVAFFGEKDWQQLVIIKRIVKDLNIPTVIQSHPTVRNAYGLALSSRNAYLSTRQLNIAYQLNRILQQSAKKISQDGQANQHCSNVKIALINVGFEQIDYIECRTANNLILIKTFNRNTPATRIFAAVRLGRTRLIDNYPITHPLTFN